MNAEYCGQREKEQLALFRICKLVENVKNNPDNTTLLLLRHHEYLIIMRGVTSESPPSDSSQAEFHR